MGSRLFLVVGSVEGRVALRECVSWMGLGFGLD